MARVVIVDDTSDRILYGKDGSDGYWFPNHKPTDQGPFGPPFKDSVHSTYSNAFLSFAFSGTSVVVNGLNHNSMKYPTWTCSVDGTPIDGKEKMPFSDGLTVCQQPHLPDGPHSLTIDIVNKDEDNNFWLDHIRYTPSPDAILKDRAIIYQNDDRDLQYGPGWYLGANATMTNQTGSSFELDFTGTAVSGFSILPSEFFESNSMPGTYSIDGKSPQSFDQPGHFSVLEARYNQRFFQSPSLKPGDHKLIVTYLGSAGQNPLFLDYLIVENYPTAYAAAAASKAAKVKKGAIAGGVVGGVLLLLILFCYWNAIWEVIWCLCDVCICDMCCCCCCKTTGPDEERPALELLPSYDQPARR